MNAYDAAHHLARALKESEEYRALLGAKEALEKDKAALEMINDLRRQQLEIQQQKLSGLEVSDQQLDKLERLAEIVNMNQTASSFLQAEYRFAVVMNDIQQILAEAVDDLLFVRQEDEQN